MGFKQRPSVLLAKITPVIYQLKDFKRVFCVNIHFLIKLFNIILGNFSHFEYFIKLTEQFM